MRKISLKLIISFLFLYFLLINLSLSKSNKNNEIIIDCAMTFEEAIKGTKAPKDVIDNLCILEVKYYSFDSKIHSGQIVLHKDLKQDVEFIFDLMLKNKFPVKKVIPIVQYNWSDDASMNDNNTSSFNYRFIAGTQRISNHAKGRALDINPFLNPVIHKDGSTSPKKAKYNTKKPGTFSIENFIVKEFVKRGWRWGGTFSSYKDNHHFDKE